MPRNNDPDQLTDSKTIYDVSKWEIFWRNMLAGAGRAIGGIIFQIIFLVVLAGLFAKYVMPTLQPLFDSLSTTTNVLQQFQQSTDKFR